MPQPRNYLPDPRGRSPEQFDIRNCVVALQKFLFCGSPTSAEEFWWRRGVDRGERGPWTEIRGQGVPSFYIFNDGVNGRSGWELPPDVRPEDVTVISLPSPAPKTLRNYYKLLVDQFDENDSWMKDLRVRIKRIEEMEIPNYDQIVTYQSLNQIRSKLASEQINAEYLEEFISNVDKSYNNFRITGPIAADLAMIAKVLCLAIPYRFMFVPGFRMDSLIAENSLASCLSNLVNYSLVPGEMTKLIRQACDYMQSKGEELQDSALNAENSGEFYGRIYGSIFWFFGAQKGLNFLIASNPSFPSEANDIRIALNYCEERGVVSMVSVQNQFADTLDYRELLGHVMEIEKERQLHGESAAEQLADQYIETEMLYPPYAKNCLLGHTKLFPHRKSAS